MGGIVELCCVFILLGAKGLTRGGLPFSARTRLTGPQGKAVGSACILIGLAGVGFAYWASNPAERQRLATLGQGILVGALGASIIAGWHIRAETRGIARASERHGFVSTCGDRPRSGPGVPKPDPWPRRSLSGGSPGGYDTRMDFEWDPAKANRNLAQHGVSFAEAATVLGDALAIALDDPDQSAQEGRFRTFGLSAGGIVLVVSHTDREDRTRIIGARRAGRKERKIYERG